MDNKINYTVVGLFFISLSVAAVVIFLWLTSLRHEQYTKVYLTYLREEVSGLNPQSPVRFNGVKVGFVSLIELSESDPQQVKITMRLDQNAPVTTSTIATLNTEGITGISYIGLKALTANAPKLQAKPGKQYPIIPSEPSFLVKLSTAVQAVTHSIEEVSTSVKSVFDEQNRKAFSDSLHNINRVTATLAANSRQINSSLKSLDKLLQNSATASEEFPALVKNMQGTLKQIRSAAVSIKRTGYAVTGTIETAQSSLKDLSVDLIPGAQGLLQRMNSLTITMQELGDKMQQNPSVLIRGAAPAALGPGEK